MSVSLFNFQWVGVYPTKWYNADALKTAHAEFNRRLLSQFPKQLYTNPYSSYLEKGIFSASNLFANAETELSPTATKSVLIQMARDSGIDGLPEGIIFSQKTIAELKQGQSLGPVKDVNNALMQKLQQLDTAVREADFTVPDLLGGMSITTIGIAVVALIVLTRR